MDSLTERQRAMLDFERQWWATTGGKESAIRERFGVTPVRYYQLLHRLIKCVSAESHDPVTVHRLQRLRLAKAIG